MRLPILLAATLCLALGEGAITPVNAAPRAPSELMSASPLTDVSAAQRKKRVRAVRGPGRAVGPIACMRGGCRHIPAGCQIVPERSFDGTPTGFDTFVCPGRGTYGYGGGFR